MLSYLTAVLFDILHKKHVTIRHGRKDFIIKDVNGQYKVIADNDIIFFPKF